MQSDVIQSIVKGDKGRGSKRCDSRTKEGGIRHWYPNSGRLPSEHPGCAGLTAHLPGQGENKA